MPEPTEKTEEGIFEIERQEDTVFVTPLRDLSEFEFHRIEAGAEPILRLLEDTPVKNIVMDFHKTDYYGSTALAFFIKLWKRVRNRNGRMAFCKVSDHEREILTVTQLDRLWPIYSSRGEATKAVKGLS